MVETMLEAAPIIIEKEQPTFVQTPYVKDILKWAFIYIKSGYPIHLQGPSGTGKTTLALYIAAQIGRPVILIHGDEEFSTSDLVGQERGYRSRKVVDNFIHSVLKSEEDVVKGWMDNRLTVACKHGFTLVYDEFTRSRPEANNVLLSILEEKMLDLPSSRGEENHLRLHPDFTAIFTSNPEEYAGVHKAQDALRDRIITMNLSHYDRDTEIAIAKAKSGISHKDVEKIVDIIRDFRSGKSNHHPTVRACVMLAKVVKNCNAKVSSSDEDFVRACMHILDSEAPGVNSNDIKRVKFRKRIVELINKHC